ncbi:hypothetical protein BS78_01G057600 [Paspalum vaginatum]|nr:hypothetical protein BS78_01G057600 [Paspalum vaginatum]
MLASLAGPPAPGSFPISTPEFLAATTQVAGRRTRPCALTFSRDGRLPRATGGAGVGEGERRRWRGMAVLLLTAVGRAPLGGGAVPRVRAGRRWRVASGSGRRGKEKEGGGDGRRPAGDSGVESVGATAGWPGTRRAEARPLAGHAGGGGGGGQ